MNEERKRKEMGDLMKVYTVHDCKYENDFDESTVWGVFSTLEGAKEWIKKQAEYEKDDYTDGYDESYYTEKRGDLFYNYSGMHLGIQEWTVDRLYGA